VLVVLGGVAVVAIVFGALVIAMNDSDDTRPGVIVEGIEALRRGDVMPIRATLPGAKPQTVSVFVVRPSAHEYVALRGVSTHLGCRVAWVKAPSARSYYGPARSTFEDPCGGSTWALDGEWCGGPAPRSLDRFRSRVTDGSITIDLNDVVQSPRRQITQSDACLTR